MQVNLHATYRIVTGVKSVQLDRLSGATIENVLIELVTRYPQLRLELFGEGGTLLGHVHVFVNRRDITHWKDNQVVLLQPDDVIDLFPPISGGFSG